MGTYYSYKFDRYEICLEKCLNGFDVALYLNSFLVGDKVCTNISNLSNQTLIKEEALRIANKKMNEIAKHLKITYPVELPLW